MNNTSKPTVALLYGGRGYEHDVSLLGAEYVFPLIDTDRYTPIPVYISQSGDWFIPKTKTEVSPGILSRGEIMHSAANPIRLGKASGLVANGELIPIAAAFPLLHGNFGEDGIIQGALECAGIPYVGCNVRTSALTVDKRYTKIVAEHLGIPTARWLSLTGDTSVCEAQTKAEKFLGYPMFIKPASLGSSVGAGIVRSEKDFDICYRRAAKLDSAVMIEECIAIDRELECAYFSTRGKQLFTNIGEIRCGSDFYDYDNKYSPSPETIVNATTTVQEENVRRIHEYSRRLTDFLELRDLSRIDWFLSTDGRLIFNEINTLPGFTGGSLYPKLIASEGISPSELVNTLIQNAISRGA